MALDTAAEMVNQARILTQDLVQPYRYSDQEFLDALNTGILESKRIRPDMWPNGLPSDYLAVDTTPITIDPMYRMAFVYYMCGQAQLRDEEETQDTRAVMLLQMFYKQLMGLG